MATFFLMAPGYWSKASSPTACWQNLRRLSGRTKAEVRKQEYFMLEFAQDNLRIDVNEIGAWYADGYPVRLVEHNGLDARRLRQLAEFCREGQQRVLDRHRTKVTR